MVKPHRATWVQALLFFMFSMSAGVIEAGTFTALENLATLPYWAIHLISQTLSVLWNFTLNRRYTFRSASNVPRAMLRAACFYLLFTPLSLTLGQLLADHRVNDFVIKGGTMACNLIGEFFWSKYVTFRGTEDTNTLALRTVDEAEAEAATGAEA